VPGSIDYHVLPGLHRGDLLESADRRDSPGNPAHWWQPTDIGSPHRP
jgi:hypothetical protein